MRFLVVVFALFLAAGPALAQVPQWTVNHAESRVGFTAWQSGTPVPGTFESIKADIRFDRDRLAESGVDVRIDIASVSTGSMDRDQTIKSPSLFHAQAFPLARFKAEGFVHDGGDIYIAQGELTMRGETHPVDLPFNLRIDKNAGTLRAVADGEVSVQRLRWGIGQGQWEDTSMVPNEVRIEIRIVATRPVD